MNIYLTGTLWIVCNRKYSVSFKIGSSNLVFQSPLLFGYNFYWFFLQVIICYHHGERESEREREREQERARESERETERERESERERERARERERER